MTSIAYSALRLAARADEGGNADWRKVCTLETCPMEWSFWGYRPSLIANILFAVLFGLSTVVFLGQGVLSKRFLGFTIAMVSGCLLEVIGYVGRILAYNDLYTENPFLIQIICLTIGPAFLAAGVYLCLSRIVVTFGPENSRIAPLSYPRIFIPCDFVSLLLQAGGGALASIKTHSGQDPEVGNNIMIAGLSVQVVTLLVFIILALDFAFRTVKRVRQVGAEGALDPTHAKLRSSRAFKGFLIALSFATLCIFTRSVYRVAELSDGWTGKLIKTQSYFIGLEGAIISAGVMALNFFHPGLCFREGYDNKNNGSKGCCGCFGRKKGLSEEEAANADLSRELK